MRKSESCLKWALPLLLRQESELEPHLLQSMDPQSHLTGRAGKKTWKQYNPETLEWRGRGELITPTAKPVAVFCQGTWGTGRLESRPKKSISGLGAFLLHPSQQSNSYPYLLLNTSFSLPNKETYQSTQEAM